MAQLNAGCKHAVLQPDIKRRRRRRHPAAVQCPQVHLLQALRTMALTAGRVKRFHAVTAVPIVAALAPSAAASYCLCRSRLSAQRQLDMMAATARKASRPPSNHERTSTAVLLDETLSVFHAGVCVQRRAPVSSGVPTPGQRDSLKKAVTCGACTQDRPKHAGLDDSTRRR